MGPKWIVVAVFGEAIGAQVTLEEYADEIEASKRYAEFVNREGDDRPTSIYLAPVRSEAHA